jgi:hypothetical protein
VAEANGASFRVCSSVDAGNLVEVVFPATQASD